MLQTDVLGRYRALANEFLCKPNNQKGKWGHTLGPHHTSGAVGYDSDREDDDARAGDGPDDERNEADEDLEVEEIAPAAPGPARVG